MFGCFFPVLAFVAASVPRWGFLKVSTAGLGPRVDGGVDGVSQDSFLWDDGWDDPHSLWEWPGASRPTSRERGHAECDDLEGVWFFTCGESFP